MSAPGRGRSIPQADLPSIYGSTTAAFDGAAADPAIVEEAFDTLAREQTATDAAIAAIPDLNEVLTDGGEVRELLSSHVEEYARHCGHADLLRERIDGRVGQ